MDTVLRQIGEVPGVLGSMVAGKEGCMVAGALPSVFDASLLEQMAAILCDGAVALDGATGGIEGMDLRFTEGRIVVRSLPEVFLLLCCEKTVNIQLLNLTLNVALKKLEKIPLESKPHRHGSAAASAPARVRADGIEGILLEVEILARTAGTYWESMADGAAVGHETALELCTIFGTGLFKKIRLVNPATGVAKVFPAQIIKDDKDSRYANTIVVTLATAEAMGAKQGDQLVAQLIVGGGILGWVGI